MMFLNVDKNILKQAQEIISRNQEQIKINETLEGLTLKRKVQENGLYLKEIAYRKQTLEICLEAVKQDGLALRYVCPYLRTKEVMEAAVRQNGSSLVYIEKQTEEICLLAVRQNGRALWTVSKQTKNICKEAIVQSKEAIRYIRDKELAQTLAG